jgi:TusA-related sulfurtransferase|tara:strand:+ start:7042 stop:7251 length:210 start_codon:yes stop_codon:yes gene_type:complete
MKEINVTGLQCTQAVMAVLRELMPMKDNEEIHVTYEEPNARRDIMALIKRRKYNLVKDDKELLIISKKL